MYRAALPQYEERSVPRRGSMFTYTGFSIGGCKFIFFNQALTTAESYHLVCLSLASILQPVRDVSYRKSYVTIYRKLGG